MLLIDGNHLMNLQSVPSLKGVFALIPHFLDKQVNFQFYFGANTSRELTSPVERQLYELMVSKFGKDVAFCNGYFFQVLAYHPADDLAARAKQLADCQVITNQQGNQNNQRVILPNQSSSYSNTAILKATCSGDQLQIQDLQVTADLSADLLTLAIEAINRIEQKRLSLKGEVIAYDDNSYQGVIRRETGEKLAFSRDHVQAGILAQIMVGRRVSFSLKIDKQINGRLTIVPNYIKVLDALEDTTESNSLTDLVLEKNKLEEVAREWKSRALEAEQRTQPLSPNFELTEENGQLRRNLTERNQEREALLDKINTLEDTCQKQQNEIEHLKQLIEELKAQKSPTNGTGYQNGATQHQEETSPLSFFHPDSLTEEEEEPIIKDIEEEENLFSPIQTEYESHHTSDDFNFPLFPIPEAVDGFDADKYTAQNFEQKRWGIVTTEAVESVDEYREFLNDFPNSQYKDEAEAAIVRLQENRFVETDENIFWRKAQSFDTIEEYEFYLTKYPTGVFAGEAKAALERNKNTINHRI
ncbi:hypothetical protein V6R21_09030 [Limibacter armeniacum]|uniref:hypothetical protein n=1 Tax=Limibacter armeniacum TaxID=466084 RepID=UPI002FE617FD